METCGEAAGLARAPAPVPIRARSLSVRYPDGRLAVDKVSLVVAQGERIALIGPNGAGKSTLLMSLVRLVEPTDGSASVLGVDVRGLRGAALRRLRARVGFIFQRHNLVGRRSVLANVVHGAQGRTRTPRVWAAWSAPRAVREAAMGELDAVGLADLAGVRADRLSGGQSQRVAIARAMMQRPAIMLADEPAASLDPRAAEDVMHLLVERCAAERSTLVFTSHNLDHARRYADRLLALKAGRTVLDTAAGPADPHVLGALYAA